MVKLTKQNSYKFILSLILLGLIWGCARKAEDIPIYNFSEHLAFQDSLINMNGNSNKSLISDYKKILANSKNIYDSALVYYYLQNLNDANSKYYVNKSLKLAIQLQDTSLQILCLSKLGYLESEPRKRIKTANRLIELDKENYYPYYLKGVAYNKLAEETQNSDDYRNTQSLLENSIEFYNKANSLYDCCFDEVKTVKEKLTNLKSLIAEKRRIFQTTAHIGTWNYTNNIYGINYQLTISSSGSWYGRGFGNYESGTWTGEASNIRFYDEGFISHTGSVSSDGTDLYLYGGGGSMTLSKIR